MLVKFEGFDDRDSAEGLRGPLFVTESELRHLEPDEFWHADLVDCAVVDREGTPLGTVREVREGPAQDLLIVSTPKGDRMVPLVKQIAIGVDVQARVVTIDPPEGLLD
jgi:16S rRNA processing protein RimM